MESINISNSALNKTCCDPGSNRFQILLAPRSVTLPINHTRVTH
jgi:hypothetical protein